MLSLLCFGVSVAFAIVDLLSHLLVSKSRGLDLGLSALLFVFGLIFLLVAILGSWVTKK